ncbi:IQ motif-containing protein H isoform X2 [Trichomycterus rosablanca]|uniref:IQ motif-containing protein H isoform X2 n=1 Tax=Trichomycterus rosablanca TaxID=2290929 RepID=UPI002F357948
MADILQRGDKVGRVLVQVQNDLIQLKKRVTAIVDDGTVDLEALDAAIRRTEECIKDRAGEYLETVHKQVTVLPIIEDVEKKTVQKISKWCPPVESIPYINPQKCLTAGPSAGEKHKAAFTMRILYNPDHPKNRDLIQQTYGIRLPDLHKKTVFAIGTQKVGTTLGSLAVPVPVGVLNRNPFCEEDKATGTGSFLKKDQAHCLVPIPVKHKAASQHQRLDNMPKKMDVCNKDEKQLPAMRRTKGSTQVSATPDPLCRSSWATMTPPPSAASDCRILLYNSQRLPALTASPVSQHSFSISEGRVDPHASDFCAFEQSFSLCWAAVLEAVWQLERLLRQFAVPHAQVCGERLVALVQSGKLHRGRPDCLLSVLENKKEVLELINHPGQRYRGEGGEQAAAVHIQACWRRHRARSDYLRQNKRKWAARTIGIFCWLHIQRRRVRKSLRTTRLRHLENFHSRAEWLAANWNHIINSKRTIIHMPSLGYSQQQRSRIRRFDVLQNTQIGRLCDVIDKNVEVIYVCPVRLGEDLIHYYTQLLGLHGAVETGKSTDFSSSCAERFTILTPAAHQHFPNHSMCVSTLLKYSPHTLRRIKNLIQGKHAYIVGGVPHMDDLAVADELGVPVLGPEPAVAQLYGTKSGARRIFSSAGVSTPPGHADIYTLQQLHECLSQLITDHLEVQRWLFKTDGGLSGCGIAYFDVCHVSFMPWALQEYRRHGPQLWRTAWAQERVLLKFQEALPALLTSYAKPFDRSYPNWTCFLKEFLRAGGVIEAYPPSDSVTSLTVDLLVEPGAEVRILSCGDQLHGPGSLHVLGCTVPQSSVCPDVLHSVCTSVGKACRERNILGHLSLDLVTFLEPGSLEQQFTSLHVFGLWKETGAPGRKPTQTQGEHANSTQKGPGPLHLRIRPGTIFL